MTDINTLNQIQDDGTEKEFYPQTVAGAVLGLEETIDNHVKKVNVGVTSVNSKTGVVTLGAGDVGALPAAGKAVAAAKADTATTAASATNANHATSADSATNATNAGHATTADKLTKAVTINGQTFDGSGNITIPLPTIPGLASAIANGLMSKENYSKLTRLDGITLKKVATVDETTGVVTPIK